MENLSMYQKE